MARRLDRELNGGGVSSPERTEESADEMPQDQIDEGTGLLLPINVAMTARNNDGHSLVSVSCLIALSSPPDTRHLITFPECALPFIWNLNA
jgi:hypothetical protein